MYYEVIWVGRGGQGAVTASRILAKALNKENIWAQAIVFFGAERRGAPVYAYNRISDQAIKYHHFVTKADVIVIFEPSLIGLTNVLDRAREKVTIILNSAGKSIEIDGKLKEYQLAVVDATSIALQLNLRVAGIPVINTAMVGAFAKALGFPSIKSIKEVINEVWPSKIGELNAEAAEKAYQETKIIKSSMVRE